MTLEVEIAGLVDHYVIKNQEGKYLQDTLIYGEEETPVWTSDPTLAWQYGSMVAFHDAKKCGGKVYAVVESYLHEI